MTSSNTSLGTNSSQSSPPHLLWPQESGCLGSDSDTGGMSYSNSLGLSFCNHRMKLRTGHMSWGGKRIKQDDAYKAVKQGNGCYSISWQISSPRLHNPTHTSESAHSVYTGSRSPLPYVCRWSCAFYSNKLETLLAFYSAPTPGLASYPAWSYLVSMLAPASIFPFPAPQDKEENPRVPGFNFPASHAVT